MHDYRELEESVIRGDERSVEEIISALFASGEHTSESLSQALMDTMTEVGERMQAGTMFIPEVLASAEAMRAGLSLLHPYVSEELPSAGKAVMGQVAGDVHSIGRKLVGRMLEAGGFTVVDLGEDVSAERFVEAVHEERPDIVAMSALLTMTMPNMATVIEALEHAGLRSEVRVLVGGAPVTEEFTQAIGADGFAPNAGAAVEKAKELVHRT